MLKVAATVGGQGGIDWDRWKRLGRTVEVDDVDEALEFYGQIFDFEMRGRGPKKAFTDAGGQFIAIAADRTQQPDTHRHIGTVVDDRKVVRRTL